MTKLASAPRACVIGWPVRHSRSPMIHGFWLREHELAGAYERAEVTPEQFADFVASMPGNGFVGGNVTVPHKEAAFRACAIRTPTAERLGAVNTLWIERGQLCGDNTDVAGFLGALDADAPGWDGRLKTAVVLGAGGAARAVLYGLKTRGVETIRLANRSRARAEDLAAHFGDIVEIVGWDRRGDALSDADILVNTTSLGMKGQPPLDIDLSRLPDHAVVDDIVYVPLDTHLLICARARGLRAVGGLGMLLHQAAPGFERWFGVRPRVSPALRALVENDVRSAG